jgi:hypothetical protein
VAKPSQSRRASPQREECMVLGMPMQIADLIGTTPVPMLAAHPSSRRSLCVHQPIQESVGIREHSSDFGLQLQAWPRSEEPCGHCWRANACTSLQEGLLVCPSLPNGVQDGTVHASLRFLSSTGVCLSEAHTFTSWPLTPSRPSRSARRADPVRARRARWASGGGGSRQSRRRGGADQRAGQTRSYRVGSAYTDDPHQPASGLD